MKKNADQETVMAALKKYRSVSEASENLGVSRQFVYNCIHFSELADEVQAAVEGKILSRSAAMSLRKMTVKKQLRYLKMAKRLRDGKFVKWRHRGAITSAEMCKIIGR